ncbi:hypothetical protein BJ878DRAFT_546339 [Calycina marina]|uniref:Zn(2)-C6 fungal-type domain-containing protein n=1 Tax=Calycina marina TaxID=1763456 RepID=A0A9P7YVA7_9HELO|nr:hypothetical protein BJ878DRAFT_546339 [Calycina marina]
MRPPNRRRPLGSQVPDHDPAVRVGGRQAGVVKERCDVDARRVAAEDVGGLGCPDITTAARSRRVFIVATYNSQDYLAPSPGFDLEYGYRVPLNNSPVYSASTVSDHTLAGDQQLTPSSSNYSPAPSEQQKITSAKQTASGRKPANTMPAMGGSKDAAAAKKPKRVRTGCLTCRERHLKCDEGLPNCVNCTKSSRECKRGVRLNFIDTQVKNPHIIAPTKDWKVTLLDESRLIASEYQGGEERYPLPDARRPKRGQSFAVPANHPALDPEVISESNALAPMQSNGIYPVDGSYSKRKSHLRHASQHHSHTRSNSSYLPSPNAYNNSAQQLLEIPSTGCITDPEELLFIQVYQEEVALWMDSMDFQKHFSRILVMESIHNPKASMLRNAFLACGARHLTLVNPSYHENRSLYYYDMATAQLLRCLQNPERDMTMCATTAVVLNVYEIMSERAQQRMNHIAGARALVKECGWSARSTGVGAACFWLNIGMEILSCLHFNWQVAWEPDMWGIDMDVSRQISLGNEELWVHRMLYIIGKIANFRANIPRFREADPSAENDRQQSRFAEWQKLKDLCDNWNAKSPQSMHPMAVIHPSQTSTKSAFPEVWLLWQPPIVGALFYHTAMCLMAQINPLMGSEQHGMNQMMMKHAHMICGITAHVKDRGVASVALRSLAIAAECLVVRREQEEVLEIFEKIRKETGWNIGFLHTELRAKWSWTPVEVPAAPLTTSLVGQFFTALPAAATVSNLPPAPKMPPRAFPPSGILNPLLKNADFSNPNHPYKEVWTPHSNNAPQYSNNYLGF